MHTNDELTKRLNFRRIPVLPPGAPYLLQTLMDDSIGFNELAGVIERFPSIAARLIALANSAWSSPVREIVSLEHACTRLGFDVVRSTSIALAVSSPFQPARCPGFESQYFWTTSLLTANAATWLSSGRHSGGLDASAARAAGLLHNLGLLWMADQLPVELNQAIALAKQDDDLALAQAQLYLMGFDYCEVGMLLGESWELPETIVHAMAYHLEEEPAMQVNESAELIGVAASLVGALQHSRPWPIPQQRLQQLQITPADATAVLDRLNGQLEITRELAKVLFARS